MILLIVLINIIWFMYKNIQTYAHSVSILES